MERVECRIVEFAVAQEDAPLRTEEHAALGFGGMRGQHRGKAKSAQQRLQLRGIDPSGTQGPQSFIEGAAPQRLSATHLLAALLMLEGFFSDVGEAEIGIKSPDHMIQHFRVQRSDEAHQLFPDLCRAGVVAQIGKSLSQDLHCIQYMAALSVAQSFSQHAAQQFYPVA